MTTGADWLDQARRLIDVVRTSAGTPPEAAEGTHGADCRWCPVCQTTAVLRGERPEVTAALADVLTTTAAALRAFAEPPGAAAPAQPAPAEEPPGQQPAVQRIDIA